MLNVWVQTQAATCKIHIKLLIWCFLLAKHAIYNTYSHPVHRQGGGVPYDHTWTRSKVFNWRRPSSPGLLSTWGSPLVHSALCPFPSSKWTCSKLDYLGTLCAMLNLLTVARIKNISKGTNPVELKKKVTIKECRSTTTLFVTMIQSNWKTF